MKNYTTHHLIIHIMLLIFLYPAIVSAQGEIRGIVIEQGSKEPLVGANVIVLGTQRGAATGIDGRFLISQLTEGVYSLEASYIGYGKKRIENITVENGATIEVRFELEESAISLGEIIVTPGHYSLMEKENVTSNALKAEDIRTFPQLGEDIYRAVTRLPGLSGNDFSSKFTVRGGEHDEVLVLLDGLELYDPFHLKDFGGMLSVIDVEAIERIDLMTGAFPAEYGRKLSGVFNMKTLLPVNKENRTSFAVSFMNARFVSEGTFDEGNGNWLLLARRGYLDLILKLVGEDDKFNPVYYDILGKVHYFPNSNHSISVNFLTSDDDMNFVYDQNQDTKMNSGYSNTYGWATWNAQFHPKLFTQTVVSKGRVDKERFVQVYTDEGNLRVKAKDNKGFDYYGLKQNWSFDMSNWYMLKWGFDAKKHTSDYDYYSLNHMSSNSRDKTVPDTLETVVDPKGNELGLYISNRFKIINPLTVEIGGRYDHSTWTGDNNFSPRFNAALDLTENTVIRTGWGRFYQSQMIHKLNIGDGDTSFHPADISEHRVVGIEHKFNNGINLRLEVYSKKLPKIRPKYMNYRWQMDEVPEAAHDRIRLDPEKGKSEGIEIYLKKDTSGKHSWWLSYGLAKVENFIDGEWILRNFDQRHTFYLDYNFRPNRKWRLNFAWQYHTGWPYTEETVRNIVFGDNGNVEWEWVPGAINGMKFPAYHRLDFRINRYFETSMGVISAFLEIRNLYNRKNIREWNYDLYIYNNGNHYLRKTGEEWIPILPSFGISLDLK